ncbi:MAG TPA: tRNA preQ1(34) S-adenosylmethionine ribosyltransferase-isomerase QueA [Candidatus Omnitrophota bacterium]|nr:tRNA preQ1(34) S-adenosylmethionine ribosyltransferase-isomerase QueA [Candidatus Omnitrophota bacterium]
MKREDFGYALPPDLIAQFPLKKREDAKLLVIDRATRQITHDVFANIGRYLPPASCLVVNDSKVIPARLFGKRETGGQVEIFLLKRLADGYTYETLIKPLKKLQVNEPIYFNGGSLIAQIKDKENRLVRFNKKIIKPFLRKFGHMPLPPYIRRPDQASDRTDYQTVYAKKDGSVASPTAGLHFTKGLLAQLKRQGHTVLNVTLHVNYGTFKPVEEEDITRHRMHHEEYEVSKKSYESIQQAKTQGHPVIAVGTTACRVLETVAGDCSERSEQHSNAKHLTCPLQGNTNLFIYPGYSFKMVDCLITNFHFPYSTLLMLVSAFAGHDLIMKVYREAIEKKYRFYSYGDGMLII